MNRACFIQNTIKYKRSHEFSGLNLYESASWRTSSIRPVKNNFPPVVGQVVRMKYLALLFFCGLMFFQNAIGQIRACIKPAKFEIKADSLYHVFRYDSAAVYYCNAANLYEQEQDWLHCAKNNRLASDALLKAGRYDTASYYTRKALAIGDKNFHESNKDEMFEKSDIILKIADIEEKKGKFNEELSSCKEALELILKTDSTDSLQIAKIWNKTGVVYDKLGKLDSALLLSLKALDLRIKLLGEYHIDIAESHYNIGRIYYKKGEYDNALEYFQKALKIQISMLGEMHPDVAGSYNSIGVIFHNKGEDDKALEYYQKALRIRISVFGEMHPDVAASYNNIGIIYGEKGEYNKAIEYCQKALKIKISVLCEIDYSVAISYINIGAIHWMGKQYNKALEYFLQALKIQISILGEMHPNVATSFHDLALIYYEKGEYDKALEYAHKALKVRISVFGKIHPEIAGSYINIGAIFVQKNEYQQALQYYQKSLMAILPAFSDTSVYSNPKLINILSEPVLLTSLTQKANAFYQLYRENEDSNRNIEASLSTYELAFQLINDMRNEYNAEATKLLLSENTKNDFAQAVKVAIAYDQINPSQSNYAKAFDFMEEGKSATISAQLNEIEAKHFAGIPDSLLEKGKELKLNMNFYLTEINKEKSKKDGYDTAKVSLNEDQYFKCSRQNDSLVSYFETTFPEYYSLKYSEKTATVKEIQSVLDHQSALINYFIGDTALFIATITDSVYHITCVKTDSTFERSVIDYYRSIKKADVKKFLAINPILYNKLILPIKKQIAQKENLVIIPDDYLYYIPFETLIQDSTCKEAFSDNNYLINNHSITYHYSASLWFNNKNLPKNPKQAISNDFIGFAPVFSDKIGNGYIMKSNLNILDTTENNLAYRAISNDGEKFNTLPYTEEELSMIIKSFEKQRKKAIGYFNEEATKENFKQNIKQAKYIHLATHGFANDKNPGSSGLAFSQPNHGINKKGSNDDGIIYSGEIYNLELKADLVVLSACETGIGKMIKGEGMIALTRGFLYAGASNIVYSLWSVPDKSTKELMVGFYHNILKGHDDYAIALRNAKLKMIKNPNTSFPQQWAGFILLGK